MEDFNELAGKIGKLSDAELEKAIRSVGEALGADARTVERMARERGALRKKIGRADGRELEKIASMLTPEQLEAVKNAINQGGTADE